MEFKNAKENMVFHDETVSKRILFADKNILCFILNLKAGQNLPSHQHENSTIVLYVLSGSGEIRINDEDERITIDSFVQANGTDNFAITVVNEDMSLFVCISPNPSNQLYSQASG